MDESIIVYTKYYSEVVIQTIEEHNLNIQILCFSSYDDVMKHLKETPNVRGLIFLEHKVRQGAFTAYTKLITVADEIAQSTKQPFCISIISSNELPRKFVDRIDTDYVDIMFHSFSQMSTDVFKYEGLATIISRTIGTIKDSILLTLDTTEEITRTEDPRIEFLSLCLKVATMPVEELSTMQSSVKRFPKLERLITLRTTNTSDAIYDNEEGVFQVFCKYAIESRNK